MYVLLLSGNVISYLINMNILCLQMSKYSVYCQHDQEKLQILSLPRM